MRDLFDTTQEAKPPVISDELPWSDPALPQRTKEEFPGDPRLHRCAVCGEIACFGFDVSLRLGKDGRWACGRHRDEVRNMKGL